MSTRDAQLELRGMSCANCASTIQESLEELPGVERASANFATDEGSVTYDPEEVTLAEIYEAVEDAGYEPVSETVTVAITDMSCANCAEANAESLLATPGVIEADVNYATDEAQVRFNPADTDRSDLYDAVEDAGYTPVRESEGGEADGDGGGERPRPA